jgi:hypothetical protein
VEYGNDVEGTAFDEVGNKTGDRLSRTAWNLRVSMAPSAVDCRCLVLLPSVREGPGPSLCGF